MRYLRFCPREHKPGGLTIEQNVYENVRTVSYGAVVTILGEGTKRLLNTATNVLLTRGLGGSLYSAFALSWRLVLALRQFTFLGSDSTVVRDGARSMSGRERSATATLAYGTTYAGGTLLAILAYALAPVLNEMTLNRPELTGAFQISGLILPFAGLVMMNGYFFRSQKEVGPVLLVKDVGWPFVRFLAVALTLYLGADLLGILWGLLLATALFGITGKIYTLLATDTRFSLPSLARIRSFYNHAAPSGLTKLSIFLRIHVYIFLVGTLIQNELAPGLFNVVLILGGIASIPLQGFNKLLPPIAADLYGKNQLETLRSIYTAITRLLTMTTLPLIAYMALFGHELLVLFGREYTAAYGALLIFLAGRLVGNCVGATGWLLMMTDNQYWRLLLDWMLALINLPVSYYLISHYQLIGAVTGYSFQMAGQNLLQLLLLWRYEGLYPHDRTYLKPLFAVLCMVGVTLPIKELSDSFTTLASSGALGGITYILCLYGLGFERMDREVAAGLLKGVRRFFRN